MNALLLMTSLALASVPAGRAALPIAARDLPAGATSAPAAADEPMYLVLSLQIRDAAALERLIRDQHDPAAAEFHQYLSPSQFGDRFGFSAAEYGKLSGYLAAAGLTVKAYPNRLFVRTTGTVAQYEKLLGVTIYDAQQGKLRFFTFRGVPALPTELSQMVLAVGGLDTRNRPHHLVVDDTGQRTFGPSDLRAYYDLSAVHAQGFTGSRAKAAMLGTYPAPGYSYNRTDITAFYSQRSHATTQLIEDTSDRPNNSRDMDSEQGLDIEEAMDAEMPTVAAPGLISETMVLVGASELFTTGIQDVVNGHPDINVVSVSFGSCEDEMDSNGARATDNAFAQGAAEGQAWFIASGDDGITGCAGFGSYGVSSGFPSDSPHVVSVGGTQYTGSFSSQGSVSAWGSETTWNESFQGQSAAGGGGPSTLFSRPVWQSGPGTSSANTREQPDIALLAAVSPGIGIQVTDQGQSAFVGMGDGTSVATPLAAGIFALVADAHGGCQLGLPNAAIYQMGAAQAGGTGPQVFHDIRTGNISANGVTGPSAGPGYDEATGWGSLDAAQFITGYTDCGPLVGGTSSTTGSPGTTTTTTGTTSTGTTTTGTTSGGGAGGTTGSVTPGTTGTPGTTTTTGGGGAGSTGGLGTISSGGTCNVCTGTADCGGGEICVGPQDAVTGLCEPSCHAASDCQSGYDCVAIGAGNSICYPQGETCAPAGSGDATGTSGSSTTGGAAGGGTTGEGSGGTAPPSGGCGSAGGGLLFGLLALLPLARRRGE